MVYNFTVGFVWNAFTDFEWIKDWSLGVVLFTLKVTLVRCGTSTQILVPIRIRCALVWSCCANKVWWVILMRIIRCSSYAVFSPPVIKDCIIILLRDAQVIVIFKLVEWVALGFRPTTLRLEITDKSEETGASLFVVLILVLLVFRQTMTDMFVCNRESFIPSTCFQLNCARKVGRIC